MHHGRDNRKREGERMKGGRVREKFKKKHVYQLGKRE